MTTPVFVAVRIAKVVCLPATDSRRARVGGWGLTFGAAARDAGLL